MDDQRRPRRDDDDGPPPAEGVRIIGPDEAAEAMERDDVAPRRGGDLLRYGDRPPKPPAGPRPALRFPLDASADPTRIERPPVQPPPDPVTGPVELPHWTDPPTGEVPAVLIGDDASLLGDEHDDDLDAWSSFATSTPRWRDAGDDWGDDGFMERLADDSSEERMGALGDQDEPSHAAYFGFDDLEERVVERTGETSHVEAGREADHDDPSGWGGESVAPPLVTEHLEEDGSMRSDEVWADDDSVSSPYPDGVDVDAGEAGPFDEYGDEYGDDEGWGGQGAYGNDYDDGDDGSDGDRDLTTALAVGGGMAVVAAVSLTVSTAATAVLVAIIATLASVEYFAVLRKVGWEAATPLGIAACAVLPLAIYWRGPLAYPLVAFLVVVTILTWYLVGAGGRDPRVLEGSGATLLGVFWIGGLGSVAAAMLRVPDGRALLLTAILATVAYDVGALLIGRYMGHRPLSAASPNKTVEGLIGGIGSALAVVIVVVGILQLGPWSGPGPALVLGLGAAVAAPLGDLCQSLVKRDLGQKDMSTLLPGHGGVLDRFDGMLFVIPTIFWLAVTFGTVG
ncbi:hypothetical protein BH23ACT2_BH23ACT2_29500 [soil metagenome]